LFDVELFLRISNPDKHERKNFFEYPVLEWTEIPGSNIKLSDVIKGGFKMISLILNQWKIRSEFQDKRLEELLKATQILRSGETLSVQSIKAMQEIISDDINQVTLDFTNVGTLGPSVFTTLAEVCENLRCNGKEPIIHLPDNEEILSAARRSSFTALFNCTIRNNKPKRFNNNDRFSLVEA